MPFPPPEANAVNTQTVRIVDLGRGPQIEGHRLTVMDVFYYLHRGYDFDQVITHLSYGTEGFYGVPIYVSATYIFLFILFGSFLERAGMIQLFTDVSLGLFGGTRGGPAKVAVFASGMMGMISGSGVANVVTVGQFTIPLMIKFGYRRAFAAGVEATASMGGQIMPPVMGAVAFIMAETLGVDYSVIVKAAVIPAMLYFASAASTPCEPSSASTRSNPALVKRSRRICRLSSWSSTTKIRLLMPFALRRLSPAA